MPEDSGLIQVTVEQLLQHLGDRKVLVLVGLPASGKSTLAQQLEQLGFIRFNADDIRRELRGDANDQSEGGLVMDTMYARIDEALACGQQVVVDIMNLKYFDRKQSVKRARAIGCEADIIILDVPKGVCIARDKKRARQVGANKINQKAQAVAKGFPQKHEGRIIVVRPTASTGEYLIVPAHVGLDILGGEPREKPASEAGKGLEFPVMRSEHNCFDIIGDVHGCYEELVALIGALGYKIEFVETSELPKVKSVECPRGRRLLFVGDLPDRGPATDLVLNLVMQLVAEGVAHVVCGNHDDKVRRYLKGNPVSVTYIEETIAQLNARGETFKQTVLEFLTALPLAFETDTLIVVHAAYREQVTDGHASRLALLAQTTGKFDEHGHPERSDDWEREYSGTKTIVHGHVPVKEATVCASQGGGQVVNVDTGCCFGGKLTAVRFPEMEFIAVPAKVAYATHAGIGAS